MSAEHMRRSGRDASRYTIHIVMISILFLHELAPGIYSALWGQSLPRTNPQGPGCEAFPKEIRPQVSTFGTTLLRSRHLVISDELTLNDTN